MKSLKLDDIPGARAALNDAARAETQSREDAWLELRASAGGFPLRALTVRDYVVLLRLEHPLLFRAEPTLEELTLFIWLQSPQFEAWCNEAGWRRSWLAPLQHVEAFFFARRCRKKFGGNLPASTEPVVRECLDFIDAMFLDRPPGMVGGAESGLHFITGWMDTLRSEYHCTREEVWLMPLPQLFACLKAIHQRTSSTGPDFNTRRDEVNRKILRALRTGATLEDLQTGKVKIDFTRN